MAMLTQVAAGHSGPVAFLWQAAKPGLVLPERFARTPGFDTAAAACAAAGWPVAPRKTGGGITPQGPGVLNLALAFRAGTGRARTIRASYADICDPLAEALAGLGIKATTAPVKGSFCDGDYNLAVGGRKLIGTAQRWRGEACLAHALILTDIALAPAVAAVQLLSDGLGHDTRFDPALHCRLADLTGGAGDPTARLVASLWPVLARRGFSAWPGMG